MGVLSRISGFILSLFGKKHVRIGIYGPPNAGKTTLANRIAKDWTGEIVGEVSEIPHETRKIQKKDKVIIKNGKSSLTIDIVDTPGIATKIDFHDFMEYGLSEEEAKKRAKEATEGVIEAIKWLDNIDGVILLMDSTKNPFTQVNITLLGNLEARELPFIIVANKIDLNGSTPATLKSAFPKHDVIPISALEGINMDLLYEAMVRKFGKRK
ncbi:MAG: 50S ribosome-binding GTPase [Thermoplasmatales archaeon]|nr:50S ribosome-binding GTPase [Thermoplasmatales archaeon]